MNFLRQLFLLVALILSGVVFRTGEPLTPQSNPKAQIARPLPVARIQTLEPASLPIPTVEPKLDLEPEISLSPAPAGVMNPAVSAPVELDLADAPPPIASQTGLGEIGHFVRYLNQHGAHGNRFLFLQRSQPEENSLGLGKLRAGYGMIFRDDSLLVRGRNGTAWEEPGCLYVKATFRF